MSGEMLNVIQTIQKDYELNEKISEVVIDYYNDMERKGMIKGGCHLLSTILHIILLEFNVSNELCLGNVKYCEHVFSHSWVSINNMIYDVAITHTNDPRIFLNGIVFNGIDTSTGEKAKIDYGVLSESDLIDPTGKTVSKLTLGDYASGCPRGRNYIWEYVIDYAKGHKKHLNASRLKEKYSLERWVRK